MLIVITVIAQLIDRIYCIGNSISTKCANIQCTLYSAGLCDTESHLTYFYNDNTVCHSIRIRIDGVSSSLVSPYSSVRNCYFSRQCHCVTRFRSATTSQTARLEEETHFPMQTVSLPITWNTTPLHRTRKL